MKVMRNVIDKRLIILRVEFNEEGVSNDNERVQDDHNPLKRDGSPPQETNQREPAR